tara:strand:+ start:1925 stop:2500 length:576 start_codon:yes stop_codon:yes gene_type:complete
MFAFKNKYYLIIENIKDIDLSNVKIMNKFNIIYRNTNNILNLDDLSKFRKNCRKKKINFFVSNNYRLTSYLKADGLYISAHNQDLRLAKFKNSKYKIIGSAHNLKEINIKILQGCSNILFSRLFKTSYAHKNDFLGVVKYNLFNISSKIDLVPLGGIRINNLNKISMIKCDSFALLSEVKKKPTNLFSRLF